MSRCIGGIKSCGNFQCWRNDGVLRGLTSDGLIARDTGGLSPPYLMQTSQYLGFKSAAKRFQKFSRDYREWQGSAKLGLSSLMDAKSLSGGRQCEQIWRRPASVEIISSD